MAQPAADEADPLALLVILREELKAIATKLHPPTPISISPRQTNDILTDNGLSIPDNEASSLESSPAPSSNNDNYDDEKAALLESPPRTKQTKPSLPSTANPEQIKVISCQLDDLISNFLSPSIKQLNRNNRRVQKRRKKGQQRSQLLQCKQQSSLDSLISNGEDIAPPAAYSQSMSSSSSPFMSPSLLSDDPSTPVQQLVQSAPPTPLHATPLQPNKTHVIIDHVTETSVKVASCFRKVIGSFFCGCNLLQCLFMVVVVCVFGVFFMFYKANDVVMVLRELNRWKELSVQEFEHKMTSEETMAKITFDMDVDIDKMKQEHMHREAMALIGAKQTLTQKFMDQNTRTVTTSYWNLLTTETETVSQTIFSEEDLAYFQANILLEGFDHERRSIESPQGKDDVGDVDSGEKNETDNVDGEDDRLSCSQSATCDDFDSM